MMMRDNESSSSPLEHQAKKTKLNIEEEDIISKFSSSPDEHPLTGPLSYYSSSDEDDYADSNLNKLKLSLLVLSSSSPYAKPIYPLTFIPNMSISDYVTRYSSFDVDDLIPAEEVSLAGLIMDKHIESESTFIYKLHCLERKANAQVQVIAKTRNSYMKDAEFSRFHCSLKPGVFLGVSGLPVKTENGDPAFCPSSYVVLTREPKKPLPVDPDWNTFFNFEETSSLKRYQEIMRDNDVAPIFKLRYEIVDYIASFLKGHIFFKGGTPLNVRPGLPSANDCIVSFHSRPSLLIWDLRLNTVVRQKWCFASQLMLQS